MPPNLVNYGPQTADNGWRVFDHPLKFARRLTFATHLGLVIFARWRLWLTQMPRAWLALVRLRARRAYADFHCFVVCANAAVIISEVNIYRL